MRIKLSKVINVWNISLAYIFSVLFTQIMELFLPFSITKIYALLLFVAVLCGAIKGKNRFRARTIIIVFNGIILCALYLLQLREVFSYVYPGASVLMIFSLYLDNVDSIEKNINLNRIENLVLIYCILNVLLYVGKIENAFQIADIETQFKGALPHSNMFGSVMTSLFIFLFWDRKKKAMIDKILISFLVLGTMSRTYIALIVLLWGVSILTFYSKKIPIIVKGFILSMGGLIIGSYLLQIVISKFHAFNRFQTFAFAGNGREWLIKAFIKTMRNSSLIEKMGGSSMSYKYLKNIEVVFAHSFTENSYMGIFLIFGIIGSVLWIMCCAKLVRMNKTYQGGICILACGLTLFVQDSLLSLQVGMMFLMSLLVYIYMANNHNCKKG